MLYITGGWGGGGVALNFFSPASIDNLSATLSNAWHSRNIRFDFPSEDFDSLHHFHKIREVALNIKEGRPGKHFQVERNGHKKKGKCCYSCYNGMISLHF
jgi:hypothetical protein